MRMQAKIQITCLIALTMLCVWALRRDAQPAWGQSPVSPLLVPDSPIPMQMYIPFVEPAPQTSPLRPAIRTAIQDWFAASHWASPWTWFFIGIVTFSGIAFGLVRLLKKSDRAQHEP